MRTQPHPFVYTLSIAAYMQKQHSWVAATETVWPKKTPKYLLSDPLQKIFTHPCSRLLINVMYVPLQCWVISPMEAQAPVMSSPYHLAGVLDRAGGQPLLPDNLFSLPEKPRALS